MSDAQPPVADTTAIETLLEMGFSRWKAQRALDATKYQGVEAAMDWLIVHGESMPEEIINTESQADATGPSQPAGSSESEATTAATTGEPTSAATGSDVVQPESTSGVETVAKSLKCDECGKLFKSDLEVEFHAAKSGHSNFSESTEEIRPLTEEEKKEQLRLLEEKIKLRRLAKEEQERKEQIAREKSRRRTGQEVVETKKRLEEEEMRRIAELRRREKMEEKLARQRVLEQIALDKEARKAKFSSEATASSSEASSSPSAPASTQSSGPVVQVAQTTGEPASKKEYTETRLQIRLPNGQILTQSFGSKEELAAVRVYIEINRTDGGGPFTLMTTFPKKVFSEEDMEKPLYQLGLVPTAVLILSRANTA